MIDYRAGEWAFHTALGWTGSLVPKGLVMAVPNALITFFVATMFQHEDADDFDAGIVTMFHNDTAAAAQMALGAFTVVMTFILYNRSQTAYDRWWEGGTLLQKTRGEWFNAYSSIMAFTSTKPEIQDQVEAYTHLLARLMSLLMCCGLQQVSPNRDRPFEIIDLDGIEPLSMEFLNSAPDKVEIILQWIQRSMILQSQTGVLAAPPPILSRAFQEVSRGIVNLQNARKIADFPYPYPLAQISMILQLVHWAVLPFVSALALPRAWAVIFSFFSVFVLWCIHFNAIELEFPFGSRANDLPMIDMQQDWNKSICTLLNTRATRPPMFEYDPEYHNELAVAMSDASELYIPKFHVKQRNIANIKIREGSKRKAPRSSNRAPGVNAVKGTKLGMSAEGGGTNGVMATESIRKTDSIGGVVRTDSIGSIGRTLSKKEGSDIASGSVSSVKDASKIPSEASGSVKPGSSVSLSAVPVTAAAKPIDLLGVHLVASQSCFGGTTLCSPMSSSSRGLLSRTRSLEPGPPRGSHSCFGGAAI
eukprot:TRINITY_DN14165_c0_g7_i1.p1 TRINITY_DN14165_c0_g7~~TRINITY_DN14165_c0_g7_i1.p1  ORF type:complete len:532 (-),score=71.89 TRINITY_DN14165_c0_g7_i1:374-1969(-)